MRQTNAALPGFYTEIPAIKGIQAGREYYVAMCPLGMLPKIFLFDEQDVPPELRAQRTLNHKRVPEIARYILDNREDYVFSALTVSVDGDMIFVPHDPSDPGARIGQLRISMDARMLINDGQHRRAAIELALKEEPGLTYETIAVVFFHDRGLKRSQQMFSDLNRHAVRPARSLNILYDHRNPFAEIARRVADESNAFRGMVEKERTSLAARSRKLFTLSAIHSAVKKLLGSASQEDLQENLEYAIRFWDTVGSYIRDWRDVREGRAKASEIRQEYVHASGVVLQALGAVGNSIRQRPWPEQAQILSGIERINWSKHNPLWEGRILFGGRLKNSGDNVLLASAAIKRHLGIPLASEEKAAEERHVFEPVRN